MQRLLCLLASRPCSRKGTRKSDKQLNLLNFLLLESKVFTKNPTNHVFRYISDEMSLYITLRWIVKLIFKLSSSVMEIVKENVVMNSLSAVRSNQSSFGPSVFILDISNWTVHRYLKSIL